MLESNRECANTSKNKKEFTASLSNTEETTIVCLRQTHSTQNKTKQKNKMLNTNLVKT